MAGHEENLLQETPVRFKAETAGVGATARDTCDDEFGEQLGEDGDGLG